MRSLRSASRGRAASRTRTRLPLLTRSWVARRIGTRSARRRRQAARRAAPGSLPRAEPRTAAARFRTRTRPPALRRARSEPRTRPPGRARAPRPTAASSRCRRFPRRPPTGRHPGAPQRASLPAQPTPPRARATEAGRSSVSARLPPSRPSSRPQSRGPERGGKPSGGLSRPTCSFGQVQAEAAILETPYQRKTAISSRPLRCFTTGVGSSVGSPRTRMRGVRAQSRCMESDPKGIPMSASIKSFGRGRAAGLVLIALVGLGLAYLHFAGGSASVSVPSGAHAGQLTLKHCTYANEPADCGTLVVPENRHDPHSRLIALPITRIRAHTSYPGVPIFRLQGGPGLSNMDFPAAKRFTAHHDFVLFGYRGVDGSSRLDCPEVIASIEHSRDLLSRASLASNASAYRACAKRLQDKGVDLAGYSLPERVDDLELARHRLGYGPIDLISESAGTRTAMIYAWRYPHSIHRSVMVAANPPGNYLWNTKTTDEQIHRYAALCAQAQDCRSRTPDLAASIHSAYTRSQAASGSCRSRRATSASPASSACSTRPPAAAARSRLRTRSTRCSRSTRATGPRVRGCSRSSPEWRSRTGRSGATSPPSPGSTPPTADGSSRAAPTAAPSSATPAPSSSGPVADCSTPGPPTRTRRNTTASATRTSRRC